VTNIHFSSATPRAKCDNVLTLQFANDIRRAVTSSPFIQRQWPAVGRRPDDGVWYDFSDAPLLLFYVYSAFVDDRTSPHSDCNDLSTFVSLQSFACGWGRKNYSISASIFRATFCQIGMTTAKRQTVPLLLVK